MHFFFSWQLYRGVAARKQLGTTLKFALPEFNAQKILSYQIHRKGFIGFYLNQTVTFFYSEVSCLVYILHSCNLYLPLSRAALCICVFYARVYECGKEKKIKINERKSQRNTYWTNFNKCKYNRFPHGVKTCFFLFPSVHHFRFHYNCRFFFSSTSSSSSSSLVFDEIVKTFLSFFIRSNRWNQLCEPLKLD